MRIESRKPYRASAPRGTCRCARVRVVAARRRRRRLLVRVARGRRPRGRLGRVGRLADAPARLGDGRAPGLEDVLGRALLRRPAHRGADRRRARDRATIRAARCARAALSFVAFDSYKSANPTNGSFVLARARDGETQARGDFFAAHWRPATAADVAVVRGDDAPGEEPLELVVTDARGRSASTS